ncbi:MAG: metal ABC transporter substrate-binding protein [Phycisphaerae bacterium]
MSERLATPHSRRTHRRLAVATAGAALIATLVPALVAQSSASRPAPTPTTRAILCSVTPVYLLAQRVAGQTPGVSVELLLNPNAGCPHGYSLSPAERRKLETADIVLTIGLGLETFLDPVRAQVNARFVELGTACRTLDADHACDHNHDHAAHDHAISRNPHVWMSPAEMIRMTERLTQALVELDPLRRADYERNGAAYVEQLNALAAEIAALAARCANRKVAAPEAFAYLTRDLKLDVVTTLPGHEGEDLAPRDLGEQIRKIRAAAVDAIICERGAADRVPRQLARETGVALLELDALSRLQKSPPPVDDYEARLRDNLLRLQRALRIQ